GRPGRGRRVVRAAGRPRPSAPAGPADLGGRPVDAGRATSVPRRGTLTAARGSGLRIGPAGPLRGGGPRRGGPVPRRPRAGGGVRPGRRRAGPRRVRRGAGSGRVP